MSGLILTLLLLSGAAVVLGSCPSSDWLPIADECYLPLVSPFSQMEADKAVETCRLFGIDVTLPQIFNEVGQERVHELSGGNYGTWLSLRRNSTTNQWLWPGGSPLNYTYWREDEPSYYSDCAAMDVDGLWFTTSCDSFSLFVICYCQAS